MKNTDQNGKEQGENKGTNNQEESKEQASPGSLHGAAYQAEDVFENAEPWDPVETKVVLGSFIAALICLIIFGYLINIFILH